MDEVLTRLASVDSRERCWATTFAAACADEGGEVAQALFEYLQMETEHLTQARLTAIESITLARAATSLADAICVCRVSNDKLRANAVELLDRLAQSSDREIQHHAKHALDKLKVGS